MKRQEHHPSQLLWIKRALVDGSRLSVTERRKLYVKVALVSLLIIWGLAASAILITPTKYTSRWTLILPGAGAGSLVNLDSIGQATSSSSSPYLSSAIDPRENYKAISTSKTLLDAAAATLQIKPSVLGKPKLKLPSQTGLIHFSIKANSAALAAAKANAHYQSLQALLSQLRRDEIQLRENGIRSGLDGFANKVSQSQAKILSYQSEMGLVSLDQFKELALTMEKLRFSRVNMISKLQGLDASKNVLETHLGLDSQQAADLLILKNDQYFQQLLVQYTQASTELVAVSGRFARNHPQVLTIKTEQNALLSAMQKRCKALLGYNQDKLMLMLSADDIDGRADLMKQLLSLASQSEGLRQEVASLDAEIKQWDARLSSSNDDAAKLEDLHREHQLATAVFTSALAKMDVGKADIYSAYPMVQLLTPPSTPDKPDRMAFILTLIGAVCASIFALTGLIVLWIRKPILRKILTSA